MSRSAAHRMPRVEQSVLSEHTFQTAEFLYLTFFAKFFEDIERVHVRININLRILSEIGEFSVIVLSPRKGGSHCHTDNYDRRSDSGYQFLFLVHFLSLISSPGTVT